MFESHVARNAQLSGVLDPRALGANYSLSDYGGLRHRRQALGLKASEDKVGSAWGKGAG